MVSFIYYQESAFESSKIIKLILVRTKNGLKIEEIVKLIATQNYISQELFRELLEQGIFMVTRVKKNIKILIDKIITQTSINRVSIWQNQITR